MTKIKIDNFQQFIDALNSHLPFYESWLSGRVTKIQQAQNLAKELRLARAHLQKAQVYERQLFDQEA